LRRVGGREFAAIAGAILAARMEKIPVLLDGFATTAAAAVLYAVDRTALDHCMFSHVSTEPGHARLLAKLGARPLLGLGIYHGEAVGAGLAAGLVKTAAQISSGMAAAIR
jgi:nicotinate-nucleotide--dimethylbenzimidazole phosphoribosyltransferase